MYGLTRGSFTLIGAAGAGFLLWLASQTNADSLGGYWAFVGLIAAAGLAMAFSQLLGGWTKWGWPRVSGHVFVLGFLPGLVAGGLVLLARQPDDGAVGTGWAGNLGVGGLATDLTSVLPAIAFGLGLLFGFTFDTTGPRVRETEVVEERDDVLVAPAPVDARAADEPVAAERETVAVRHEHAPELDRNGDGVDDRDEIAVGTPSGPVSVEAPDEPRRRRLFHRD